MVRHGRHTPTLQQQRRDKTLVLESAVSTLLSVQCLHSPAEQLFKSKEKEGASGKKAKLSPFASGGVYT